MKTFCNKFYITFYFFFVYFSVFSQDYQAFKPGIEYYFSGKNTNNIHAVMIDSFQIFSDTMRLYNFYNIRNPVDTSNICYNPFGASWIGSKIIVDSNGHQLFFNRYGDTILIDGHALLFDCWKMFHYSDGSYIEAKITSVDTFQFLDITDTVKVITLSEKDKNGNDIGSGLNHKQLILSKNYGFIQVLDFYYFPDYQTSDPDFLFYPDTVYQLVGTSLLSNGITNITAHEIYEYHVGDEFHTEYIHTPVGPYTQTKEYKIKKIIDKIISANKDTITYSVSICSRREVTDTDGDLHVFIENDTVLERHIFSAENNKGLGFFPGESFYNIEAGHFEYMNMSNSNDHNERLIKFFPPVTYLQQNVSCYIMGITTPAPPYRFYVEGCGGEYYIGNYDKEWGDHYILVYFKKGTEIWGIPLDCDVLLNKKGTIPINSFTIFPNPAYHTILLRFENEITQYYNFIMFDALGRIVKKARLYNRINLINVDDIKSGIFFYEIWNYKCDKRITGKIIIKKY